MGPLSMLWLYYVGIPSNRLFFVANYCHRCEGRLIRCLLQWFQLITFVFAIKARPLRHWRFYKKQTNDGLLVYHSTTNPETWQH